MIRDHSYEVLMPVTFSSLSPPKRCKLPVALLVAVLACVPAAGIGPSVPPVAEQAKTAAAANDIVRAMLAEFWLPREQLSAARRAALPEWCEGGYKAVDQPVALTVDPAGLPIHAAADEASYFIDDRVELRGGVEISRGNRRLRTDSALLYESSEKATLGGNVRVEEPGLVLLGEGADVDLASESAELDNVTFLLTEAGLRGSASNVTQSEDGNLLIREGSVTRCDPGNNTWSIRSKSIRVDDGAIWGTARSAVVRIKDVPIFYLPYIRFPVDDARQSGWLFPDLGYSNEDGVQIAAPYYLNLAPDWDATLTPRLLSNRGVGIEGELRHKNRYGDYKLGSAYLPRDRLFDGLFDRDDFRDAFPTGNFDRADRWLLSGQHEGGLRGRLGQLNSFVDYTAVSDPDYFRDLGTAGLSVSSRVEIERRGGVRYRAGEKSGRAGGLDAQLWAQRFQRLDEIRTEAYQRLPQLDLSYAKTLLGPLEFNLVTQAASFDRDNDNLVGLSQIVGERYHVQPELRLPLQWPYAFAELTGGFRYTAYDLRDIAAGADDRPDRSTSFASADGGLFFERPLSLFGKSLVQTLEPRLFYLYQERDEQDELPLFDVTQLRFSYSQLFRRNRFSGLDRISDANQLSAGITSALIDARSGRQYLRASVGQIFFFQDRTVTDAGGLEDDDFHSTSAIAAELRASLTRHWSLNSGVIWDPNDNTVDETLFNLNYRASNRRIANIGYRQGGRSAGNLEQTDVSFLWGVSKRWNLLGRWNYDFNSNRTIEGFAGLEYNNCCWQLRVIARSFIENRSAALIDDVESDKGVFFQFVFKGLAGFGAKIDTLLQRGIRGYRPDDSTRF